MKNVTKKVTKKEYNEFIANYQNDLEFDIYRVPEPPIGTHNDFSDGKKWPESVVGKIILEGKPDQYQYYIQAS